MEESRLYQITGKHFPTSPARLKDFKKLISHLSYPYIVPSKGSRVDGLLIRNVDVESLAKIDSYEEEGRLYFRKKATAICGARKYGCEIYVGNEKFLRSRP